jgi:hypothetical protein
MKERDTMKNVIDNKRFAMTTRARKAVCSLFLAGGLFGAQAKAALPTTPASVPDRVAAVRAEINRRVAEAKDLGGLEAVTKLPYAQVEVASWLNWVNWSNWNNWRNWNNWANWSNWFNF